MVASEVSPSTLSRRRFLRRLAATAGVGLGLAILPTAQALAVQCCRDSSCPTCSGSNVRYRCTGCGTSCCKCLPEQGPCFTPGGCLCLSDDPSAQPAPPASPTS